MTWIEIIIPPVLMIIGGIISWFLKTRSDELKAVTEMLREEQRKIYSSILDPYIQLFSDLSPVGQQKAITKITSYEYKKDAFNFNLIGTDNVIIAYNNLMQFAYQQTDPSKANPAEMMLNWGKLLLEIRRAVGNKNTKLKEIDMLKGMVKDIEKIQK